MASPNFDILNLQHSNNISDVVGSASVSGNKFTSVQRSYHINTGIRRWLLLQALLKNYNALISYLSTITTTTVGASWDEWDINWDVIDSVWDDEVENGVYTLVNVMDILSVYCDNKEIKRGNEEFFGHYSSGVSNKNNQLQATTTEPVYLYGDGKLFIYPLTDFIGKSLKIHYVKTHTDLIVGGGTDILIPQHYWQEILDYAVIEAMNEVYNKESVIRIAGKKNMIEKYLSVLNNTIKEG